jgi:hypothetical protein
MNSIEKEKFITTSESFDQQWSIIENVGSGVGVAKGVVWCIVNTSYPFNILKTTTSFDKLFGDTTKIQRSFVNLIVDESNSANPDVNVPTVVQGFIENLNKPEPFHCLLKLKTVDTRLKSKQASRGTDTSFFNASAVFSTVVQESMCAGYDEPKYSIQGYPLYYDSADNIFNDASPDEHTNSRQTSIRQSSVVGKAIAS